MKRPTRLAYRFLRFLSSMRLPGKFSSLERPSGRALGMGTVGALVLLTAPAGWGAYPDASQTKIAQQGQFVGGDRCQSCHDEVHGQWKTSRHTVKVTPGPAQGKQYLTNVYDWVRRDWDKLDTFMIVDQKDKDTVYVSSRKVALSEVDYVIGRTYKQRYATYYDGGPVEVWESRTQDGGISWVIDKSRTHPFPGNKERTGYKFLHIEVRPKDGDRNPNNYGEFRSWQERCIACHTTGFDHQAWDAAKAEFVGGKRKDLRDIFVADLRIGCEACHGPGSAHASDPSAGNIINPAKITDVEARKMVCEQCHTRPQKSLKGATAQDLRGYRLTDRYMDFAEYTRPAWGKGNRQVSVDGKGRRDHQQDMDVRLSATIRGSHSVHADMACFDCHDAHGVGNDPKLKTLKQDKIATCAACHGAKAEAVLRVMDGRQGWEKAGFPNWGTEYGRQANKQHVFRFDGQGRSLGLAPDQYPWALKAGADRAKQESWMPIWPWEKAAYEARGNEVVTGPAPWN
jgi:predicted CXXCH cytochrome family protein